MNIVACKASFRKLSNCHNPPLYWLRIELSGAYIFICSSSASGEYTIICWIWLIHSMLSQTRAIFFFFVQSQLHIFQVFHYLIGKKIFEKLFEWNFKFCFSMTWEWSWCEICMPHHCHYVVAASSKLETWKNKKKPQRHSLRSTFLMSFLLVFCKLLVPLNLNVVVFFIKSLILFCVLSILRLQ